MNNNNNNKNRFLAVLLVFLVSLCAVLSAIFSGILLAKSENDTAYADSINYDIEYRTSNLVFCGGSFRIDKYASQLGRTGYFKSNSNAFGDAHRFLTSSFSFFIYYEGGTQLGITDNRVGIFSRTSFNYYDSNIYYITPSGAYVSTTFMEPHYGSVLNYNSSTFNFFDFNYQNIYLVGVPNFDGGNNIYGIFQVGSFYTGEITLDKLLYVDIFSVSRYIQDNDNPSNNHTDVCTVLDYVDYNYIHYVIVLMSPYYGTRGVDYNVESLPFMQRRRYYLSYALENSIDTAELLSRQYYDNGYNDGSRVGYNAGLDVGYDTGYDEGYSEGEYRGKIIGASEANQYTFFNLISAVIDAPVKAFTGLLNFDVLGFNILGFITGLLTLGLIIWVITILLGKK